MTKAIKPARWARQLFGADLAATLMEVIPEAIQAAVRRQMDGHDAVRLSTRHAFGGAWPARYEELASHLEAVPGAQVIRPFGKSYKVALVNNVVVLPFEYAKDLATQHDSPSVLRKINKTTLELARQFGPEPQHTQPAFEGLDLDPDQGDTTPDLLRGLEPDGIVVIYYAAHERQGLLKIGWGEISVNESAIARWVHDQPLAIPAAALIPGQRVFTLAASPAESQRFDQGELGTPVLTPRKSGDVAAVPPVEQVQLQRHDKA